jgi:hypothetical protein
MNITCVCRPLSVEVLNEQRAKVHHVLHVGVECPTDDAHLGVSHGPRFSLSEDGVRQEDCEVANHRVLDGGGLLLQIVQVHVHINTLLGFLCLLDNLLSNLEPSSSGEPEATTKLLKSKAMRYNVQRKTHSGVSP